MNAKKIAFIVLALALILGATYAVTTTVSAAPLGGKDTSFCNCDGDRGWGAENGCAPLTSNQESYCQRYA